MFVLKKSSRQQLNNEINKYKALQKKLDSALETISQLKITIQEKDKMINHSNIYAHRRFGSRLGKSGKLSISSASSMISLAPMDEEDLLSHSLKNTGTKEDDLDFNFDDQNQVDDNKIDLKADQPSLIQNSPKIPDKESPKKSPKMSPKIEVEDEKVDEQENPFDFKANEDTKQRNVSSAKDYYDGFYDNHQEDKKLSSEESVLNVNSVTPIPSPRKSSKEDPEQENKAISSPDKGSLIERQNSFKTTQKFFQENGTIIEPKEYKKAMVDEPEDPNEPLETSRTKKYVANCQTLNFSFQFSFQIFSKISKTFG